MEMVRGMKATLRMTINKGEEPITGPTGMFTLGTLLTMSDQEMELSFGKTEMSTKADSCKINSAGLAKSITPMETILKDFGRTDRKMETGFSFGKTAGNLSEISTTIKEMVLASRYHCFTCSYC